MFSKSMNMCDTWTTLLSANSECTVKKELAAAVMTDDDDDQVDDDESGT